MAMQRPTDDAKLPGGVLCRLARDRSGNTFAMVAAAVIPLLAMIGGGVDMGRSYLTETRLQQACDAGVLAARKKLGTQVVLDGTVPTDVDAIGQKYFAINFAEGKYGSEGLTFDMTVEQDLSISGVATTDVPTSVMHIFGTEDVPIEVQCEAKLAVSNTDIMMVLDVTGSMAQTNPGDSQNRIDSMRNTIVDFHTQLEGSKTPGTRIRYGFVPYSTNVNVAGLLEDDWVVHDRWNYQSRQSIEVGREEGTTTYERNHVRVSGTGQESIVHDSYPATYHAGGGGGYTYIDENENVIVVPPGSPHYSCDTPAPTNTYTINNVLNSTRTEPFAGPPVGTRTIESRTVTRNGAYYWLTLSGTTCQVMKSEFDMHVVNYERVTDPTTRVIMKWQYKPIRYTFTNWRWETNGCIEERDTYEISDYGNVDFTRALDLDLDTVPSDDASRWRPARPWEIFARSRKWDDTGDFVRNSVVTNDEYVNPSWIGLASCPAPARKLEAIDQATLTGYLATLYPTGQTYHDIGMIWGGRLISSTGLFADENADVDGKPTNRHLIFLTDGETAPLDLVYGAYGIEPVDGRRWDTSSALTLTQTVESRFVVACDEVRRRNVTIWVIGFGTEMTPVMQQCAGNGHWFQADDAAELNDIFGTIARTIGELRISK